MPGRGVLFGAGARGSLPTRPLQIGVPIRWDTGSAAAPEPPAPARSDGEYRPRNKTRIKERMERVPLLLCRKYICRSKKILVPVAMGRHRRTGALPNRRQHIEYRYVRVRELQPHRRPRHRPVRRGTPNRVVWAYELRGGLPHMASSRDRL